MYGRYRAIGKLSVESSHEADGFVLASSWKMKDSRAVAPSFEGCVVLVSWLFVLGVGKEPYKTLKIALRRLTPESYLLRPVATVGPSGTQPESYLVRGPVLSTTGAGVLSPASRMHFRRELWKDFRWSLRTTGYGAGLNFSSGPSCYHEAPECYLQRLVWLFADTEDEQPGHEDDATAPLGFERRRRATHSALTTVRLVKIFVVAQEAAQAAGKEPWAPNDGAAQRFPYGICLLYMSIPATNQRTGIYLLHPVPTGPESYLLGLAYL
ncbi:hypothetical protein HYPSUDRAFT_209762 [Hypholoma sublateritium FD-334 SS-4]|uniref:Uncharacterized protein n=1 Tax=Hypholoma sublateritium (strain FD-334 SS-4) TaxID=945553 RepID=A0A0D2N1X9_HYPSF|nr:hypothetical protein HYPSUDRAFT_209762 [Hypholoma sublateritium FD-334 SS-4]